MMSDARLCVGTMLHIILEDNHGVRMRVFWYR
jgi:hypothetical protein